MQKLSPVFGYSDPELDNIKQRWTDSEFVFSTFPFLLNLTFQQPPKDATGRLSLVGLPEFLCGLFRDTELIARHWSEIYCKILGCREKLEGLSDATLPEEFEWRGFRQGMLEPGSFESPNFNPPNEESSRRPEMSAELPECVTLEKVLNFEGHDDLFIYREYVREMEETRRKEAEAVQERKRRRDEDLAALEADEGRDLKYANMSVTFVEPTPERQPEKSPGAEVLDTPSSLENRPFWSSSRRKSSELGERRLSLSILDRFRRYSRSSKGKEPCREFEEPDDRTPAATRSSFLSQSSRKMRPNLGLERDALEGSAIE